MPPPVPPPPLLSRLVPLLLAAGLWLAGSAPHAWDAGQLLRAAGRHGGAAPAGAPLLVELIRSQPPDMATRLRDVNEFFNRRLLFQDDARVWGRPDYWASPLETLAKGAGDCEDFAIAKFFTLVAAGVPAHQLRLVYVRARLGRTADLTEAHMVLAWYATPEAEPLVLDNLISEVRPASRRPDLAPVFSFNAEGLWEGAGGQPAGDPLARLSRWRELLLRAREEGFL